MPPNIEHPPLYAWMELAEDGRWGIIGIHVPGAGWSQLIFGSLQTAEVTRRFALAHQQCINRPVRLVRFGNPETLETLGGNA